MLVWPQTQAQLQKKARPKAKEMQLGEEVEVEVEVEVGVEVEVEVEVEEVVGVEGKVSWMGKRPEESKIPEDGGTDALVATLLPSCSQSGYAAWTALTARRCCDNMDACREYVSAEGRKEALHCSRRFCRGKRFRMVEEEVMEGRTVKLALESRAGHVRAARRWSGVRDSLSPEAVVTEKNGAATGLKFPYDPGDTCCQNEFAQKAWYNTGKNREIQKFKKNRKRAS